MVPPLSRREFLDALVIAGTSLFVGVGCDEEPPVTLSEQKFENSYSVLRSSSVGPTWIAGDISYLLYSPMSFLYKEDKTAILEVYVYDPNGREIHKPQRSRLRVTEKNAYKFTREGFLHDFYGNPLSSDRNLEHELYIVEINGSETSFDEKQGRTLEQWIELGANIPLDYVLSKHNALVSLDRKYNSQELTELFSALGKVDKQIKFDNSFLNDAMRESRVDDSLVFRMEYRIENY